MERRVEIHEILQIIILNRNPSEYHHDPFDFDRIALLFLFFNPIQSPSSSSSSSSMKMIMIIIIMIII